MKKYSKTLYMYSFCIWLFIVLFSFPIGLQAKNHALHSSFFKSGIQNKKIKKGDDGKYIKRHYKDTYLGIKEFSLRSAPNSIKKQQFEFNRQCMAFRQLEKLWKESKSDGKERKAIKTGLLRWNWLEGDPVLNNPRPVDWYMVYMECIYRKKK